MAGTSISDAGSHKTAHWGPAQSQGAQAAQNQEPIQRANEVHPSDRAPMQSLGGASPVVAPEVKIGAFNWVRGLAMNSNSRGGDDYRRLIQSAKKGDLPAPPLGKSGVKALPAMANRRVKQDWHVFGFTIRRDQRLKAVLAQADRVMELYQAKPAQTSEEAAQQLDALTQALGEFQAAVDRYAERASLPRRYAMRHLSVQLQVEARLLALVLDRVQSEEVALDGDGRVEELSQVLEYARAGVDWAVAGAAIEAGVDAKLARQGVQGRQSLTLAALQLIPRYPEMTAHHRHQHDRDQSGVELIRELLKYGYSVQQIDDALAQGYTIPMLQSQKDSTPFKERLAPERAYLQRLVDHTKGAVTPLYTITVEERRLLSKYAKDFASQQIEADVAAECLTAGYKAVDSRVLLNLGVSVDQISAAGRAGLPFELLTEAHREQLSIEELGFQRRLGHDDRTAKAQVRALPGDEALGWLRTALPDGRRLLRSEAAPLQRAGLQPDSLPLADVVELVKHGVSSKGIVELSGSSVADLSDKAEALIALSIEESQPFSRAEALLLAHGGWPADVSTLSLFRRHYADDRTLVVPVNEHTARRDLGKGAIVGELRPLGAGAFNEVFALNFKDPQTGAIRQGVFKPLQIPVGKKIRTATAANAIGVPSRSPRFELRNLAHSRLDEALGFSVVPRCELMTTPDGQAGLLMTRVDGNTAKVRKTYQQPKDITQSPLGERLKPFTGSPALFEAAAKKLRVDVMAVRAKTGGYQILLKSADEAPPLLPDNSEGQRSLIALQWLHAITGACDTHDRNIMRSADGKRYVGIDNDISFGAGATAYKNLVNHPDRLIHDDRKPETKGFHGQGLPPIADRAQYEAIMKLNPASLRELLGPLLAPEEFDATVARLDVVQDHLRTLDGEGRIIGPDQWGPQSLDTILNANERSYVKRINALSKQYVNQA